MYNTYSNNTQKTAIKYALHRWWLCSLYKAKQSGWNCLCCGAEPVTVRVTDAIGARSTSWLTIFIRA